MGKVLSRLGDRLTLYVRMLAWLQATPKPPEGSKRAKADASSKSLSRIEQMKKNGVAAPAMPENPAPHLVQWLVEMGVTEAAGMGSGPISWREIHYWQLDTHVSLAPWEARLLRRLSVEYVAESRRAEEETCPPPWVAPASGATMQAEVRALDAVLG